MDPNLIQPGLNSIWNSGNLALIISVLGNIVFIAAIAWLMRRMQAVEDARLEADKAQTQALTELAILVRIIARDANS